MSALELLLPLAMKLSSRCRSNEIVEIETQKYIGVITTQKDEIENLRGALQQQKYLELCRLFASSPL